MTTQMQQTATAEIGEQEPSADPVPDAVLRWGTRLLFLYFAARLVFFALAVSSFVPPDEVTHAGLCKIFSKTFLIPENTPESYQFGLVTNTPWLYYWVMGKLLHLNIFGLPDLVFLRLLNIPLAFVTVSYALRLLRLLTPDRLTRLLLLAVATNMAMFTLLSASVSYDNLTNALAVMAIYYQFAFFRKRSGALLAASLLCQMLGSLAKVTFLPLVLALNVVLVLHEAKSPSGFLAVLGDFFRSSSRRAWGAVALLVIAGALNLQLYAGNYLKYGTLLPSLSTVVSPAAAIQYRLEARGMIFNQYKEGKISYMDAVIMAGDIKHPADKADTFYLLMNWQQMKQNPSLWMGPLAYAKFWLQTMTATIVGIKGHLSMLKEVKYLIPLYLGVALSLAGLALRWRPRGSQRMVPALALIPVFYAGYLFYQINYDAYLNYGNAAVTVYGRYLFPVIFPVYILVCRYLLDLFRDHRARVALAVAGAAICICYDFPWFLAHATPEWYSFLPQ